MAPTPAYRIALAIHDHLQRQRGAISRIELPDAAWSKCQAMHRQLELARGRDWQLAAHRLERDLQSQLQTLSDQTTRLACGLNNAPAALASARDIYQDITSLQSEFDEVMWSRLQGTLSVTTEDIVLEGIALGRFQIELDWRDLPGAASFRVIALDPNPASSNEQVRHPHVEHESLCTGDARLPIQRALEQGRISDFFLITKNVLQTYNRGSPYVSLADWTGVTCSDCGDSVDSDNGCTCEKCEHVLCESCYRHCEQCSSYCCCECVVRCETCDEDVCHHCRQTCKSCKETYCPRCVEENVCDNCQQESSEEKEEAAECGSPPPARDSCAGVAIHANGLEQVAVLS